VERDGLGRVVRCELIHDEHAAAAPRHAGEPGDDAIGPGHVVERAVRADEIEGAVGERQRGSVPLEELRVRESARPRELDELRHRIEPDDLTHERRQRERQRADPGADVEGALVAARLGELAHLLRELRRAGVLPRCDALGRPRKAVSRRRHGARAKDRN
jgi:hypothetical protein